MIRWLRYVLMMLVRRYAPSALFDGVRRRGLLFYFRAINGIRRLLVVVITLSVFLHLATISFFGAMVSLSWLLIEDPRLRLWILFGGFAAMFVVPLAAGCFLLSERFWMRLSGAGRLVEDRSSP